MGPSFLLLRARHRARGHRSTGTVSFPRGSLFCAACQTHEAIPEERGGRGKGGAPRGADEAGERGAKPPRDLELAQGKGHSEPLRIRSR